MNQHKVFFFGKKKSESDDRTEEKNKYKVGCAREWLNENKTAKTSKLCSTSASICCQKINLKTNLLTQSLLSYSIGTEHKQHLLDMKVVHDSFRKPFGPFLHQVITTAKVDKQLKEVRNCKLP